MTNIAALPVYGFDIQASNNQDLTRTVAFLDDQVVGVTIYDGGSNIAPPGYTGSSPYTGSLPANFAAPVSGGIPAIGTANILAGVLTGVTIDGPGQGYLAQEQVGLSIPGASPDVTVAVNVGNPLALDGIVLDFEARPSPGSRTVVLSASTQATINGLPVKGAIALYGNLLTLQVPEAAMKTVAAGTYPFEIRAFADGAVRVIAKGNLIVTQGVAFERG